MKTILFQGDSITDSGRNREDSAGIGNGYPCLVEAELGFDNPGEYMFVNKGVSGDRVVDLYARIKCDILNINPDIMSILIGVNDVWHEYNFNNGISSEKYEKIYRILLDEIYAELSDIKIMIMEPFCLLGTATAGYWENGFSQEVAYRAAAAKRIAEDYKLPFIKLQNKFDEAAKTAENSYWLRDGVHPTSKGHELIKREWIKAFKALGI